jgi:hypothetical protein
MANTFKSYLASSVTTQTSVMTVASNTQTTLIGLSLANTSTGAATASVVLTRSAVDYYVIKNASIPAADSLVLYGGDQKLVMQSGDSLKVTSSATVDVIASVLEVA